MAALFIFFILLLYTISLALNILNIIAEWIIFKKVGRKGWESLIPFYNFWILTTKVANLNWWWMIIYLSPFIALFICILLNIQNILMILIIIISFILCYFSAYVCFYNIAKKFNKRWIEALAMLLIPTIMFPIMAFSKNWIYDNSIIVSKNGPFKNK